jgi:hypothetical protein
VSIWATHLKLKEGELLSSWIVRLSSDCGMTAEQFCKVALSIKRPNLSSMDRSPDDSDLKALSEGTGESLERIRESSMLAEDGYALNQSGKGQTSWIIPAVTFLALQNKKFHAGMPYCPECLRTDEKPYYRKVWRYAFHPICPIHRVPLSNACPHCNEPYSHMQPVTNIGQALKGDPIVGCWSCGKNITEASSANSVDKTLLDQTLIIQSEILVGINHGAFIVPNFGFVPSKSYLDVMHYIIDTLTAEKSSARLKYTCGLAGINFKSFLPTPNYDIEKMPSENRAILLCLASWLMDEWPSRFVEHIRASDIIYSKLLRDIEVSTWLYVSALPFLQAQSIGVHSKEEVKNATLVLRNRLNRTPKPDEIKELLAAGTLLNFEPKLKARKGSQLGWHQAFSLAWADERKAKQKQLSREEKWKQAKKIYMRVF